ncbi:acyl-CoA N-acyltransferase [Peniophora sp. CONT]|nr:acyl-CoA N-acyltransferase [Peniophora sp. CONT]
MNSVPTEITYRSYQGEADLPNIIKLVQSELSEPYVVYTYRYFLRQWPHLSFLAFSNDSPVPVGVIVCKQSMHRERINRGYIAMLSVNKANRKQGVASALVRHSVEAMKAHGVEEVALETEFDNAAALGLYSSLGFIREKRLHRFYLNGKDAFRLVLPVTAPAILRRNSNNSDTSSINSSSSDDVCEEEDLEWEDVGRLIRLRRNVTQLRAAKFVPVWEREDAEFSSAR